MVKVLWLVDYQSVQVTKWNILVHGSAMAFDSLTPDEAHFLARVDFTIDKHKSSVKVRKTGRMTSGELVIGQYETRVRIGNFSHQALGDVQYLAVSKFAF